MESIDTLVVARWIAPVEPDVLLENHALAIRAGRIVALLPAAEARARFAPREIVERPTHLLTPGLVDAQARGAATLLRGLGEGLPRDAWESRLAALERTWLGPEFVRDGTLLAIAELLPTGVTCFGDSVPFPDVVAAAAVESGIRASVGVVIAETASAWAATPDEHFDKGLQVHDEYRGHPLVSTAFAAGSVAALSDATLQRLKVLVDQIEAPFVVPLHDTVAAVAACRREHGMAPLARLERLGLLDASLTATHLTHVSREEIAAAGRARIRAVHCPTAGLKLGGGIAPVTALLEAGVEVGLGSCEAAATNAYDLVHEARLAALLASGTTGDPAALSPSAALRLATLGGAAALGLDDVVGSLAPGKWADAACFDLGRRSVASYDDPVAALVHGGGRDLVEDVWVAGRRAWGDGVAARVDAADLAARAADWRRRMISGAAPAARQ